MSDCNSRNQASVLIVDDDAALRKVLKSEIARMGFDVDTASGVDEARRAVGRKDYDVVILDLRMPKIHGEDYLEELKRELPMTEVIVLTGHANVEVAIECMKKGAYDFLTKPCSLELLEALLNKATEKRRLRTQCRSLQRRSISGNAMGHSPGFRKTRDEAHRIARINEPVLLLGESGTGKELLAQEIVLNSHRSDQPFITVNCGALTETLLESELFGHERGAFTGAVDRRIGVFQLADHGTIFLDEIGDMPLSMQAKLLRTLQFGEVRPVGGERNDHIDVRVISATNQDLQAMVKEGTFRQDLFYRLNTFTLYLPPLRERGDDLIELAKHFLDEQGRRFGRTLQLSAATLDQLKAYSWPGNIRELENVIKRAVVMTTGEIVHPEALPEHVTQPVGVTNGDVDITRMTLSELEKLQILRMIRTCGGNKRQAARQLGISNKTLYNKLHAYGIELDSPSAASTV